MGDIFTQNLIVWNGRLLGSNHGLPLGPMAVHKKGMQSTRCAHQILEIPFPKWAVCLAPFCQLWWTPFEAPSGGTLFNLTVKLLVFGCSLPWLIMLHHFGNYYDIVHMVLLAVAWSWEDWASIIVWWLQMQWPIYIMPQLMNVWPAAPRHWGWLSCFADGLAMHTHTHTNANACRSLVTELGCGNYWSLPTP